MGVNCSLSFKKARTMKTALFLILSLLAITIAQENDGHALLKRKPLLSTDFCYRLLCAVVKIHNQLDDKLINPRHDLISGLVVDYPTEIDAGEKTRALYEKRSNTATGSAFMLTYDVIRKTTDKPYAKVSFLVSVPYSHDFHSNQIGVAVAFNETKHSFYKYYYMNDIDNEWMQRTAYHPVGISGKFKDDKTPNCLAISANIGNAHRTVVNIKIESCLKKETQANDGIDGSDEGQEDDTEDQETINVPKSKKSDRRRRNRKHFRNKRNKH